MKMMESSPKENAVGKGEMTYYKQFGKSTCCEQNL